MSGRAALAFTAANFAGAALNYLFQVHAAAVLDATAFGLLSAWLARLTLLGAVATVVQFLSLDLRLGEDRWKTLLRVAGLASAAMLVAHVAAGSHASATLLGVSAIAGGIVLYALVGQLQGRLQLGVVAISIAVTSALRFGLPFAAARDVRSHAFYVAHAAASFAGVVAIAVVVLLRSARDDASAGPTPAAAAPEAGEKRLRLGRPILLAFATVLFPILDVLVISSTQDAATTGLFSRVALASRIVFFSGAAALQVLLPHQLHAAATREPLPTFALRIQRWLTPGVIAGAGVLAAAAYQVLRPQGEERTWLFASCLTAALLVAILGRVNRFAAQGRLAAAAACVAGAVGTSAVAAGLAALAEREPVTRYSLAVVVGQTLVLLAAGGAQKRSRPDGALR